MLGKIIAAILDDKDFVTESPLNNLAVLDDVPEEVQELYKLLHDFFVRLTTNTTKKQRPQENTTEWAEAAEFLQSGIPLIKKEWNEYCRRDPAFEKKQSELAAFLKNTVPQNSIADKVRRIHSVFFPPGSALWEEQGRGSEEETLRARRTVKIKRLHPNPISDPAREILFTSNILVTIPIDGSGKNISPSLQKRLYEIDKEEQKYWYDHPIPIGIAPGKNEALYGMHGLDDMLKFEKERGNAAPEAKLTCLLSASTTHNGLHTVVKEYFENEFNRSGPWDNLNIFIFGEDDCRLLNKEVLQPLADLFFPQGNSSALNEVFGVDGEYGRHYSFLKAIAAFWQVFIDPRMKATFKIDLDQVFDQNALLKETGQTALQHFKTALWGAEADDGWGNPVYLGMIAGALVNHNDIGKSLFTPDVSYPDTQRIRPDELVFYSRLPQALSTKAEMMCRYDSSGPNGRRKVLQRVHVTGGTNGILIKALRTYRPFTPISIGRAEDQAYLLSVLFEKQPYLRYLHKAGLIMRHDKQAFAREAIQAAAVGKMIGDYVRILQFTFYARALPWPLEKTKEMADPFTGCFITPLPFTIVYLRFTFKLLSLLQEKEYARARDFLKLGGKRLLPLIRRLSKEENPLQNSFRSERSAWHLYYDILDHAEKALAEKDARVKKIQTRASEIVQNCKLNI